MGSNSRVGMGSRVGDKRMGSRVGDKGTGSVVHWGCGISGFGSAA